MASRRLSTSKQQGSSSSLDETLDISVKNLGKKFDIYLNDRDRVFELFSKKKYHEEFWALREISFEIPRGTAYGIIGSNGAGK